MKISSIDVGYFNLGLVVVETHEEEITHVITAEKVDISKHIHNRVSQTDCKLHHTRHMCDMVSHFIQEYEPLINSCDMLIIEKQPPHGFSSIESLIVQHFRDIIKIVYPRAMHKYFNIGHFDYDKRKEMTVDIAESRTSITIQEDRKHDIADALCMIIYYLEPRRQRLEMNKRVSEVIGQPFSAFRYEG